MGQLLNRDMVSSPSRRRFHRLCRQVVVMMHQSVPMMGEIVVNIIKRAMLGMWQFQTQVCASIQVTQDANPLRVANIVTDASSLGKVKEEGNRQHQCHRLGQRLLDL